MTIVQLLFRRDTASAWSAANPVLGQGEPAWETDTSKGKVGDGATAWNSLPYRLTAAATGTITSVNGDVGPAVVLTASDVGASALSHVHTSGQVTDLTEVVQDLMNTTIVAGTNISVSYNDSAGTLTINSTGGSGGVTSVNTRTGAVVLTKTDVGLANVDNTSDANKPLSTADTAALALKAPLNSPAFTGTPTGITKTHVGLANVDNTSDDLKPVSAATQLGLDGKADLVSGQVPLSQIPKSQSPTASTVAQRRVAGTLAVATATAADEAVTKAQLDGAAGTAIDIRTLRISTTTLTNNDALTWVGMNDLEVTGVKTGDIWRVSLEIVYFANQTAGLDLRFKNGTIYLTTADWQVTGHWEGIQFTGAATQNFDNRQDVILYPSSHPSGQGGSGITFTGGGTASGAGGRCAAKGEFEIKLLGTGLTNQAIGFEFRQHALDGTNPTRMLAGSYLTAVQVA